ncbi:MAG: serpin family protein [Acidobacteria bacterium]|nr:serpin family protein [Acidobacteriota bacterium]
MPGFLSRMGEWLRQPGTAETLAPGPVRQEGPLPWAEASAAFAWSLHARLRAPGRNLCVSPFSVHAVLAMAMAGARGATAREMRAVLHHTDDEEVHATIGRLCRDLVAAANGVDVRLANSLWVDDAVSLLPAYEAMVAMHYEAAVRIAPFQSDAARACAEINAWVNEHTRGRIADLVSGLDSRTRLVLVNAVALKAVWEEPFERRRTERASFTREDGTVIQVPMMQGLRATGYVEQRGLQAVDLAYQGSRWSMLVVLPNAETPLSRAEETLEAASLSALAHRATPQGVEVLLPRFSLSCRMDDLSGTLAAMGMPSAMDRSRADFSGMNALSAPHEDGLYISSAIHQATLDVDESGTEATAATAIVMAPKSAWSWRPQPPPIPVFRADRPFLFAIRHRESGTILFMGRVADPTAKD